MDLGICTVGAHEFLLSASYFGLSFAGGALGTAFFGLVRWVVWSAVRD